MSRMLVACFDVRDPRRLYRVAREMENFGVRVQKSVFECHLSEEQLTKLQQRIAEHIDQTEDHVRYYGMCNKDVSKIVVDGPGNVTIDPDFVML
ncbi:MAG: CRISPR-associated endonuclease Cas2 [Desulfobulbaceae bacterium]|nr:CRISPR-associated endonuclease Cas2 [Desulfobulbaceae bacterium]